MDNDDPSNFLLGEKMNQPKVHAEKIEKPPLQDPREAVISAQDSKGNVTVEKVCQEVKVSEVATDKELQMLAEVELSEVQDDNTSTNTPKILA